MANQHKSTCNNITCDFVILCFNNHTIPHTPEMCDVCVTYEATKTGVYYMEMFFKYVRDVDVAFSGKILSVDKTCICGPITLASHH